jgi:DNA-binding IclR family transcriptional regulator
MITSVAKAIDILELVANSREGLRLRQVADVLDISRQSAHKILQTLVHKKFLVRLDSPPRYTLGPALHGLREQQEQWFHDFLAPGIPKVLRLARETGALTGICQYVGEQVVSRIQSMGKTASGPRVHYAARVPAYGTGVLFQAYMDPADLRAFQARHPMTLEADFGYWNSVRMLNAFLPSVRRYGYLAMIKGSNFRVITPVFGRNGRLEAAVKVTKGYGDMAPGEGATLVRLTIQAARELSLAPEAPAEAPAGKANGPRQAKK